MCIGSGTEQRDCRLLLFMDKLFVHMSVYNKHLPFNMHRKNITVKLLHIYQILTNTTNCVPVRTQRHNRARGLSHCSKIRMSKAAVCPKPAAADSHAVQFHSLCTCIYNPQCWTKHWYSIVGTFVSSCSTVTQLMFPCPISDEYLKCYRLNRGFRGGGREGVYGLSGRFAKRW
jgi:hypothetical protein